MEYPDKYKITPNEVKMIIHEVFGYRGQARAARELRKSRVAINRWCSGYTKPEPAEIILLRLMLAMARRDIDWRYMLASYEATMLPYYDPELLGKNMAFHHMRTQIHYTKGRAIIPHTRSKKERKRLGLPPLD